MSFVDSLMDMLKNGKEEDGAAMARNNLSQTWDYRPWSLRYRTGITTTRMKFSSTPALRASLWRPPRFLVRTSR